jgi:hypothetical protein
MKKKVSFIKRINKWTKAGELPCNSLCNSLTPAESYIFDLFKPTFEDRLELRAEGLSTLYWCSGLSEDTIDEEMLRKGLTPLRQTLLCFCALLNKEL